MLLVELAGQLISRGHGEHPTLLLPVAEPLLGSAQGGLALSELGNCSPLGRAGPLCSTILDLQVAEHGGDAWRQVGTDRRGRGIDTGVMQNLPQVEAAIR
jgi:hypothetical protein